MNTLLLIDGSNLLFQMFYGMPSRIVNKDGIAIHGVIGFVGALRKIIDMVAPTHIAVLFDGECTNERKELDEQYKANRPDFNNLPEEELPYPKADLEKANALLDESLHTSLNESFPLFSSHAQFLDKLKETSPAFAELVTMDCFHYVLTERYNTLFPIQETLTSEEQTAFMVLFAMKTVYQPAE